MNILLISASLLAFAAQALAGGKNAGSVGSVTDAGVGSFGPSLGELVSRGIGTGQGTYGAGTGSQGTNVRGPTAGGTGPGTNPGAARPGESSISGTGLRGLGANAGAGSLYTGIGTLGAGVGPLGTGVGPQGAGVRPLGTGVGPLGAGFVPVGNQAGLSGTGLRGDLGDLGRGSGISGQFSPRGITGLQGISFRPGTGGVIGSLGVPGAVGGQIFAPKPFAYESQSADEEGNVQFKQETADGSGNVLGVYGYTDTQGLYRQVQYVANQEGFRAIVQTNEPGTDGKESPADVQMIVEKPPAGVQPQFGAGGIGAGRAGSQYGSGLAGISGGSVGAVGSVRQPGGTLQGGYRGLASGTTYGTGIGGGRVPNGVTGGSASAYGIPAGTGRPGGLGGISGGPGYPGGLLGDITGIPVSGGRPGLGGIVGIGGMPGGLGAGQGVRSGKSGY